MDHLLERHARRTRRASQRASHDAGAGSTCPIGCCCVIRRADDLLNEVRAVNGVSHVSSILAEDESEV